MDRTTVKCSSKECCTQIYREIHEIENQLKDTGSDQPNPKHGTHRNPKLSRFFKNWEWGWDYSRWKKKMTKT